MSKNDMQIVSQLYRKSLERMANNMKFVLNQQSSRDDGYYLAFGISLPISANRPTDAIQPAVI